MSDALQLSERYAGNKAYQQRDYSTSMHHYERALAVVNFVVGATPDDQTEVMHNKGTVLLNMAAAHMAMQVGSGIIPHTCGKYAYIGSFVSANDKLVASRKLAQYL